MENRTQVEGFTHARKLAKTPIEGPLTLVEWSMVLGVLWSLLSVGIALWDGQRLSDIPVTVIVAVVRIVFAIAFILQYRYTPWLWVILLWVDAAISLARWDTARAVVYGIVAAVWTVYVVLSDRVARTFNPEPFEAEFNAPVSPYVFSAARALGEVLQAGGGCWNAKCDACLFEFVNEMKRAELTPSRMISELTGAGISYDVARGLAKGSR